MIFNLAATGTTGNAKVPGRHVSWGVIFPDSRGRTKAPKLLTLITPYSCRRLIAAPQRLERLKAVVEVIDAVDDGFAFRCKRRDHERHRSASRSVAIAGAPLSRSTPSMVTRSPLSNTVSKIEARACDQRDQLCCKSVGKAGNGAVVNFDRRKMAAVARNANALVGRRRRRLACRSPAPWCNRLFQIVIAARCSCCSSALTRRGRLSRRPGNGCDI